MSQEQCCDGENFLDKLETTIERLATDIENDCKSDNPKYLKKIFSNRFIAIVVPKCNTNT
jgi:hypothetical protein